MDNQNLQAQIDQLRARLDALNASSTIPVQVAQAFQARGFNNFNIVIGAGNFSMAGTYELVIPSANKQSQVIVCPDADMFACGADIIQIGNAYGIHAEGTATKGFNWMVITGPLFLDTSSGS